MAIGLRTGEQIQAGVVFMDRLPEDWDPMFAAVKQEADGTYKCMSESRFSQHVLETLHDQIRDMRIVTEPSIYIRRGDEL